MEGAANYVEHSGPDINRLHSDLMSFLQTRHRSSCDQGGLEEPNLVLHLFPSLTRGLTVLQTTQNGRGSRNEADSSKVLGVPSCRRDA